MPVTAGFVSEMVLTTGLSRRHRPYFCTQASIDEGVAMLSLVGSYTKKPVS